MFTEAQNIDKAPACLENLPFCWKVFGPPGKLLACLENLGELKVKIEMIYNEMLLLETVLVV